MLVEFETTTKTAAYVLHDLTAKIIRTPPVYRFVLQVHKIILKKNTYCFAIAKKKRNEQLQSLQALLAPKLPTSFRSLQFGWLTHKCNFKTTSQPTSEFPNELENRLGQRKLKFTEIQLLTALRDSPIGIYVNAEERH